MLSGIQGRELYGIEWLRKMAGGEVRSKMVTFCILSTVIRFFFLENIRARVNKWDG